MRILHELVVDEHVEDNNLRSPKDHWLSVLGNFETLKVLFVVDRVSGGSPTLTASLAEGPDVTSKGLLVIPGVNGAPLVPGQPNIFSFSWSDGLAPGSYDYVLLYSLGGTSPKAHVRAWVTGRGRI